jgi:hypothetical protein
MDYLEKAVEWIVWLLIIGGIGWLMYGLCQLISIFFIRG